MVTVKQLKMHFLWVCIIRRKQSETRTDRRTHVALDDMKNDSPDISASTSNLVYQNVAEIQRPAQGITSCIQGESK